MEVLVTGGTGSLGRRLVPRLERAGHAVTVGTRTPRSEPHRLLDLTSDESVAAALEGADAVIHLASDPFHAKEVDIAGSGRVARVAGQNGVHLIYVSIVGIDGHRFPYYRVKAEVEGLIGDSNAPWTIQRTTQFHDLVRRFVDPLARSPVLLVPSATPIQPIDPDVVADRMVELVAAGPSGRVADMGGPEVLDLVAMVRAYLRASGRRRLSIPVRFPGRAAAQFRAGAILSRDRNRDGRSWHEWLAEEVVEGRQ